MLLLFFFFFIPIVSRCVGAVTVWPRKVVYFFELFDGRFLIAAITVASRGGCLLFGHAGGILFLEKVCGRYFNLPQLSYL